MNIVEIVIAALIVIFIVSAIKSSRSRREARAARREQPNTNEDAEYLQRLAQLEERIRVLERIVTDDVRTGS